MKRIFCIMFCMCLLCSFIPSSFAITTKEQMLSDIDSMLDDYNYDGIINYFVLKKNEAHTIPGATVPFMRDNTLILPANLTEIGDSAFAEDTGFDCIVIPDSVEVISDTAFSGISNLTIIANEDSYAYTWANNHGYTVSSLPAYPDEFTITINNDNFDDYFEIVTLPHYNGFGEIQSGELRIGVKSKLYDLGYVIKGNINHAITVEYRAKWTNVSSEFASYTKETQLDFLASFWVSTISTSDVEFNRMVPGEITFISNQLVKSYVLETDDSSFNQPDQYRATITLEDGTRFDRYVVDGYLY